VQRPQPARREPETTVDRRFDRRAVLLVALAVFAQESVWNFFDAQVPESLRAYIGSTAVIGLVMGLDNVFGVLIQPGVGHLSDRYRARRGTRVPFILVGAPLAAVPFALIPWANSLPALIACVVAFACIANAFKGVTEALLPDHVAAPARSRANGYVKIATSLTIAISALISLLVVDRSLRFAFAIPAISLILVSYVACLSLERRRRSLPATPQVAPDADDGEAEGLRAVLAGVFRARDRSRLALMLGIFCFAGTWAALRALTTSYGVEVLGLSRGESGGLALYGSVAFLLAAVPIAYASDRIGQLRMITLGIGVFIIGLTIGALLPTPAGTSVALTVASIGYATFSINAVVALWNLAPSPRVLGLYTGLYTVAASSGNALGPGVLGSAVDVTGWRLLFVDAVVLAALALVVFARQARCAPGVTR
jgi:MFS family permease